MSISSVSEGIGIARKFHYHIQSLPYADVPLPGSHQHLPSALASSAFMTDLRHCI